MPTPISFLPFLPLLSILEDNMSFTLARRGNPGSWHMQPTDVRNIVVDGTIVAIQLTQKKEPEVVSPSSSLHRTLPPLTYTLILPLLDYSLVLQHPYLLHTSSRVPAWHGRTYVQIVSEHRPPKYRICIYASLRMLAIGARSPAGIVT